MGVRNKVLGAVVLGAFLAALAGCGVFSGPQALEDLPDDPVERAAVAGLRQAYTQSAMWEIKEEEVVKVLPVPAPPRDFVREHNPRGVWCVCLHYLARYRVPWTSEDRSRWEPLVRTILVIKTQSNQYLALKPAGLCHSLTCY